MAVRHVNGTHEPVHVCPTHPQAEPKHGWVGVLEWVQVREQVGANSGQREA